MKSKIKDTVTHPITTHVGAYAAGILTKILWDKIKVPQAQVKPSRCKLVTYDEIYGPQLKDIVEIKFGKTGSFNVYDLVDYLQTDKRNTGGLTRRLFEEFKLSGNCKTYWKKGSLFSDRNYKDGKLHGTSKIYREDGSLKSEENYKDDNRHGSYKGYRKDGTLRSEYNYKDDKLVD